MALKEANEGHKEALVGATDTGPWFTGIYTMPGTKGLQKFRPCQGPTACPNRRNRYLNQARKHWTGKAKWLVELKQLSPPLNLKADLKG